MLLEGKVLLSGKVVEYIVEMLLLRKVLPFQDKVLLFRKGGRVYSRGAAFSGKVLLLRKVVEYIVEVLLLRKVLPFQERWSSI